MNVKNIKGYPKFNSDQFLGYVLWKQSDGFHLRWTTKGNKAHNFQGKIICQDKMKITGKVINENLNKINEVERNTIEWNTMLQDGIDGLDFLTPGNFTLELRVDKKRVKQKNIFLGPQMIQPEKNPFTITQVTTKGKLGEEIKKPTPEPVYEPTPEPVYEPTPETVYEPTPEPVYEPTPETEYMPTPEPEYEPTPEARIEAWLKQLQTYRKFEPEKESSSEENDDTEEEKKSMEAIKE